MAEMKEILVAKLTLDTVRRNNIPPLIVPQGDYGARVIKAKITVLGNPVTVPNTASVSIVADRNGDSEALAFSGKVNADGSVTVPVTQWMLDVPENYVTCHIEATGIDYKYSTTHFLIEPEKKANPTEITPDDPRKDVVTEVLAGEKERVLAEGIRRTNENTRKSAEEARQRAEEQRLTDEATRVANEAERVSSELSRDATFKGWAQDIASLPSFDSRISANSDRLTNIEAGLPSSVWHVDDTAARVKDVPENARPKAIVSKIGGMTYKTENLIPFQYYDPSRTLNGVTITVGEKGGITLDGETTADSGFSFIANANNNVDGIFTLSAATSGSVSGGNPYLQPYIDGTAQAATNLNATRSYNLKGNLNQLSLFWKKGTVFTNFVVYPMLNEGSTAKPCTPYFTGLRSAKVTEVKSVGRNLIPFPYADANKTVAGVTYTDNGDGSIAANGTPTAAAAFKLFQMDVRDLPSVITISLTGTFTNLQFRFLLYDEKGDVITTISTSSSNGAVIDFSNYQTASYVVGYIYRVENGVLTSGSCYPMLNKGSTAEPYAPYHSETLPIPEAVQALDGWGQGIDDNYHNFLDWRPEDGVTNWHKVVNQLVLYGTENWNADDYNFYAYGILIDAKKNQENIKTDRYKTYISDTFYIVKDSTGLSTVADFKAYLAKNPLTVVYALAAPEVTDISDLLPADNLISVEGGGTLTFENEYGYDMPNTVTYMLKEVTA